MFVVTRTVSITTQLLAHDLNSAHVLAAKTRGEIQQSGARVEILAPDGAFILGWCFDGERWTPYVGTPP
jgi:hypothetical protein